MIIFLTEYATVIMRAAKLTSIICALTSKDCLTVMVIVSGSRRVHGSGLNPVWPGKTKDMSQICHFVCKQVQRSGMRNILSVPFCFRHCLKTLSQAILLTGINYQSYQSYHKL